MGYELIIIDETGESHILAYKKNEYPSLMEMLRDVLLTDIGDCRGRVWCNTCIVQSKVSICEQSFDANEQLLLKAIDFPNTRLSCQLELDESLDQTTWEIIDSRKFI